MEIFDRFTNHVSTKLLVASLALTSFVGLIGMVRWVSDLQSQIQEVTSLKTQVQALQSDNQYLRQDLDTLQTKPANYPVGLAQSVLTLQAKFDDRQKVETVNDKVLEEVFRNREPWFGFQTAAEVYKNGKPEVGQAMAIYAMSQMVGQKNYGCSKPTLTDPMYLRVDVDTINKLLEGSPYSISIVENRNGTSWVTISVNTWIPGC